MNTVIRDGEIVIEDLFEHVFDDPACSLQFFSEEMLSDNVEKTRSLYIDSG